MSVQAYTITMPICRCGKTIKANPKAGINLDMITIGHHTTPMVKQSDGTFLCGVCAPGATQHDI